MKDKKYLCGIEINVTCFYHCTAKDEKEAKEKAEKYAESILTENTAIDYTTDIDITEEE